jgi:hypothetical protein
VLLHLWNDRRGKIVRIGSIALMEGSSRRMAMNWRLSQRLLLLLRCLLLLFLAMLLAAPYWQRAVIGSTSKGWVLVEGDGGEYKPMIDSLVKAGYQRPEPGDSLNYWTAFRQADAAAPAGSDLYMVTPGLAGHFAGERPVTKRLVHWYTYTPADLETHWIAKAWLTPDDSVAVSMGASRNTGTSYHTAIVSALPGTGAVPAVPGARTVPAAAGARSAAADHNGVIQAGRFSLTSKDGRVTVALDSQPPVIVDTNALQIVIYADPAYQQDSRYVKAAIDALRSFTRRRIRTVIAGSIPAEQHSGWLLWLSDRPLPAVRPEHVWSYNPEWKTMEWHRDFPVLLGKLLFGEDSVSGRDRRLIDHTQLMPVRQGRGEQEGTVQAEVPKDIVPLAPVTWLLIFILFITERLVSFYTFSNKKNDGR